MQIVKTIFFLTILHFSTKNIIAQVAKDTIYFDDSWSICTKPIAQFYRVCVLNKDQHIFYKGNVADYYMNGELEMTGQYDTRGLRTGIFTFYRPNGSKWKDGAFVTGTMKGIWNFYDKAGSIKARFDCKSEDDFTPILIIKNNGDTILKNGNGSFSLNPVKDLPAIFSGAKSYNLTGNVVDGKKDGVFTYSPDVLNSDSKFEEYYKNGNFLKATETNTTFKIDEERNTPFTFLSLRSIALQNIDNFMSNDFEFGRGTDKGEKLVLFLLKNKVPPIVSEAGVYEDNYADFFNIIGNALKKSIGKSYMSDVAFSSLSTVTKSRLLSFSLPVGSIAPPVIEDTAEFLITKTGEVDSATFRGNLNMQNINTINYFLSNLYGLAPLKKAGAPISSKLKIHLYTVVKQPEKSDEKIAAYYYFGEVMNTNSSTNVLP